MFDLTSRAILSDDHKHRFWLSRQWATGPLVIFVMHNPSTADADIDDPTIRRCIAFAEQWGYGGLGVVNRFSIRSSNPDDLWKTAYPNHQINDKILNHVVEKCESIVAAWGKHGKNAYQRSVISERDNFIFNLCHRYKRNISYIEVTKEGIPRHPLYLKGNLLPKMLSF
ncbi:MAG: DUF1643 domain-containing protein [Candidimonas sp.]